MLLLSFWAQADAGRALLSVDDDVMSQLDLKRRDESASPAQPQAIRGLNLTAGVWFRAEQCDEEPGVVRRESCRSRY